MGTRVLASAGKIGPKDKSFIKLRLGKQAVDGSTVSEERDPGVSLVLLLPLSMSAAEIIS